MPAIDFKEIPLPTKGPGRDQFELFASEFLTVLGFKVIVGPDRGADAGRDMIVEELRKGIAGETAIRWLVSCKHKAHSGAAVTPDDEQDILDRVSVHNCQGFLCFYSTLPSSGLAAKLNAKLPFEVEILHSEKIESSLLTSAGFALTKRFFPHSASAWMKSNPGKAKLFDGDTSLDCEQCGKSLLSPSAHGIVVFWASAKRVERIYWCCKGPCDKILEKRTSALGLPDIVDAWSDVSDLVIPLPYIQLVVGTINELQERRSYSPEAFEKIRELIINLSPHVFRNLTPEENEKMKELAQIPAALGGWG